MWKFVWECGKLIIYIHTYIICMWKNVWKREDCFYSVILDYLILL